MAKLKPSENKSNVVPIRAGGGLKHVWNGRRAGESDESYARRRRHFEAIHRMQLITMELVELRTVAEGAIPDNGQLQRLERVLDASDAAWRKWRPAPDSERVLSIRIARDLLERARERTEAFKRREYNLPTQAVWYRDEAARLSASFAVVPVDAWERAISRWPGLTNRRRGGARRAGETLPAAWFDIVYELLKPYGLTSCETAKRLSDYWREQTKP